MRKLCVRKQILCVEYFCKAAIRQKIVRAEKVDTDFRNRSFGGEIDSFSARMSFLQVISPVISSFDLLTDSASIKKDFPREGHNN